MILQYILPKSKLPVQCQIETLMKTEVMNLTSLKVLESIEKYMLRSCILKFNTLGHFKPHIDTWKNKSSWLRLWGTTHPESVKLRYKSDDGEKLVWNDIKKEYGGKDLSSYVKIMF